MRIKRRIARCLLYIYSSLSVCEMVSEEFVAAKLPKMHRTECELLRRAAFNDMGAAASASLEFDIEEAHLKEISFNFDA